MLGRVGMRRLGASILALLLSLVATGVAQAQGAATISGTVTSETGQALYGANVTIEALAISVGTNEEGRYTITIPAARVRGQQVVLLARLFGYAPQSKSITLSEGSQTHDFALKLDVNRLTQVVVTGMAEGTEKVKVPFTIAQVSAADMPVPGANAFSQLQGKVAGMQITSSTGRPGADPNILIRAPLSINASGRGQGPLVIVDGIVFQGGISDVNPQDIESVEVVKGAAAASLYGSRAGNGVIQIQTKRGKGGAGEGVRFNVTSEYGASDVERQYDLSRAGTLTMTEDYQRYCVGVVGATGTTPCTWTTTMAQEMRRINDNDSLLTFAPRTFLGETGISSPPSAVGMRHTYQATPYPIMYDAVNQMLTNGEFLNTNVSMTGRMGGTNVYASLGNMTQEGSVVFLDGYHRNSIRVNADQQVGEAITVSASTSYSNTYTDGVNFVGGNNRVWFGLSRTPAFSNILGRDSRGRLWPRHNPLVAGNQNYNPTIELSQVPEEQEGTRFLGSVSVKYRPFTWADAEWTFGYDRSDGWDWFNRPKGFRTTPQNTTQPQGTLFRSTDFSTSFNNSLTATLRRQLTDDLTGSVTFRYLYEQQDNRNDNMTGQNLFLADIYAMSIVKSPTLAGDPGTRTFGSGESRIAQVGMFATARLDYQGKLIGDALIRRDGASVFGSENRWQTYGRASMLYRPSEENWWPVKDIVNELKLRAAYGTAGNRPQFSSQYETYGVSGAGAFTAANMGNPLLGPEVVKETDIGFEAELFSKYGVELSFVNTTADDQILQVPVPAIAGFTSQWRNAGTLENKIVEGVLNIPILDGGFAGITWSARLAFDKSKSEITQLDVLPYFASAAGQQGTDFMFYIAAGERFGQVSGRKVVTSCLELPAQFQARCGDGKEWQRNDDGYIVWVGSQNGLPGGPGNSWRDGISKNLWNAVNPAADNPWGNFNASNVGNWGMLFAARDSVGNVITNATLGSAIPTLRWSMGHNIGWNKFSAYVLFDAAKGRVVWNETRHWNYGDLMNGDIDQVGVDIEHAKPVGYYWRAGGADGVGSGGLYQSLTPFNHTTEDASFVKLRELSVGYRIGRLGRYGDWSVNVVGRNLLTWTDYTGFDPETGLNGGTNSSGILNAVDAFNFPNLRTFTLQFNVGF